ncbi:MAG: hypothetical protein A2Y62_15990 [Candidatus Fischerbacteria bacterium RBG_13_37_8]|uniref:Uncharacterized protein n=1 Tax=Candidatus Fischerbacteria bacterium RBG_13_37_8 TaxID=1817863 RepID=A0A1F5VXW6_9BACT|nr:MAG: hypothetical protein A2Y62_15990 [Candidatus Fischerbacteria bacterium RBG_13_37_8]
MNKHKVLIFGNKTFGELIPVIQSELFDVIFEKFPDGWGKHENISNYSIIILDYSAFLGNNSIYPKQQEIFEKELFLALDKGATVCFLHYNDDVPMHDPYNFEDGNMNQFQINILLEFQIGFRFLRFFSIRPMKIDQAILWAKITRIEFKNFLDKWGATKNIFRCYGKDTFDDIIYDFNKESALGFMNYFRNGHLIYLPCQRNFSSMANITEMFKTLIDNLITYLTRIRSELPAFAKEPFFKAEEALYKEFLEEQRKTKEIESKLESFNLIKALAFASEYDLQNRLPKFLHDELGFRIEQNETYNEDFWLIGSSGEHIAICEIKSYVRGFKKSGVYDIYNHREHYKKDESFPGILFVSSNLHATNWEQKLSPFAPQDYQVATSNNILIVRVEDLLFMWDSFKQGKISREEIINILISNKGWLYFKSDGRYEIKE